MSVREQVDALNAMILNGQILDAFEKFYADDVVMQENAQRERVGKAANRTYEEQFVGSITAFRGAEIKALAVNEEDGISMVQWFMDLTHKDWGDTQLHQVTVQRWQDGQVVHERFYHP